MQTSQLPFRTSLLLVIYLLTTLVPGQGQTQEVLEFRIGRWLLLTEVSGPVQFLRNGNAQPAQVGMQLQAVGEGIRTGPKGRAIVKLDTQIGSLELGENTLLQIQTLQISPNGGRITRLYLQQGQVRVRVRSFNHPDSLLELETPAGTSGVRGTDYGLAVQPQGQTGVAVLEGLVAMSAQGQTVQAPTSTQTLVIPGSPPGPVVPLQDDVRLKLRRLVFLSGDRIRLVGQTAPVNLVILEDENQNLDSNGQFDVTLPRPAVNRNRLHFVLITPLGRRQRYELAIP